MQENAYNLLDVLAIHSIEIMFLKLFLIGCMLIAKIVVMYRVG